MAEANYFRSGEIVRFGPFRLIPLERLLDKEGSAVTIGSRRLDILIALVERAGDVISQRELIARAWPNLVVEKANLRIHIAGLRKVLGDGVDGARYITNVPGRGYCFVAPIQRFKMDSTVLPEVAQARKSGPLKTLPAPLTRMIGCERAIAVLLDLLREKRFVSIVGPGGMGKTTIAIALAHALLDEFDDAVFFVDLGVLAEDAMVTAAVASALGISMQAPDPLNSLLAFAADKRILLVIDNCEHVIGAAATLTERIFRAAPYAHLLTTSRESLRVEGEYVYLLHPLEGPPDNADLTAAQALASPSVQLFMERAAAGGHRPQLSDAEAPLVASICRRLDGIALAIELVAGRVGAYGIQVIGELLNNRFRLLWQGRRTALPRHQTLYAMLDWSYRLLPDRDRQVLCRLSVFVGNFTFEAAQAIGGDADMNAQQVAAALASLIEKSLIWVSPIEETTYLRLLDVTRIYAAEKLAESPDADAVAMRHARRYAALLRAGTTGMPFFSNADLSDAVLHLGNVRAALEWSFSERGDHRVGAELAAYSAPLLLSMSQLNECRRWCGQGLAVLSDAQRGTRLELVLQEASAISIMFTIGNSDTVRIAIEHALILSEILGEVQHRLRLMAGLHIFLVRIGNFREALAVAERAAAIARETGVSGAAAISHWMLGCSHHLTGNQEAARRYFATGFKQAAEDGLVHADVFGYDHRIRASIMLARVLWLNGYPDQAAKMARLAIDEAEKNYHPVNLCIAMINTVRVFLWSGDFEEAGQRITRLITHAAKHALRPCHAVGIALKGELAVTRGNPDTGVDLLRGALLMLHAERHFLPATGFYRALAEGLLQCGRGEDALARIDEALSRAQAQGETFDMPELLRVRGNILLALDPSDPAAAEQLLLKAVERARSQSALSLELRAAIALATLWESQGRQCEARKILSGVHERFTEGFETVDLKTAAALIKRLTDCG
jgi:predicted ATPase/DNA-binding winged helix-turn-helix (wHTH) protein